MRMSIVVKIIGSSPGIIPIDDGLSFEDVCTQCCRDLDICPVSRNLFALRNETTKLYVNPSDLLKNDDSFELRLRFWPSLANLSRIGTKALNYFYRQVCEEFVEGKITAFNNKTNQSVALGLAITAMYCHMKDNGVKMSDVLTNYKKFVPKMVRRNSNLKYSTESLKTRLNQVVQNPPGETWFFKQQFLKTVAQTATDYSVEKYPVKVEEGDELVEFDLIIQPMSSENPGVKMQSIKKKIVSFKYFIC
jgi:Janus kinase 2